MIKEAAILYDGKIYTGRRHHEIIEYIHSLGNPCPIKGEHGFVTDEGEFLNRVNAAQEAIRCGQIIKLIGPPKLTSEDLY